MNSKRGISGVVVTILIVVIGIASVGVLYQFLIQPIMEREAEKARLETECMDISLEVRDVKKLTGNIRIRRGRGGPNDNVTVIATNLRYEDAIEKELDSMNSGWFDIGASKGDEIRYMANIGGYDCLERSVTIRDTTSFVLDDNLVSWWKLDNVDNGIVKDYVGSEKGKAYDIDLVNDDEKGKVIEFDGESNYINLSSEANKGIENITINVWVKTLDAEEENIYSEIDPDGSGDGWEDYLLFRFSEALPDFRLSINGSHPDPGLNFNEWPDDGNWHMVTASYEFNNGLKLYVNGSLDNNLSYDGEPLSLGNDYVQIGKDPRHDNIRHFNGSMSDLTVFNRSLSKNEVENLYFKGRNE